MIEENQQNQTPETPQEPVNEGTSGTPEARSNPELDAVKANRPPISAEKESPTAKVSASQTPPVKTEDAKDATKTATPAKPGGAPATRIGKEKVKPNKTKFLFGCAGGGLLLFIIFIVLMVLMMSKAGADNAVMRSFGLDPAGLKSFLLTVVSLAFGMLSLLFFVLMVIGIFRLIGAKKTDKETKSKGMKMTIFSLIPLILLIFLWFVLYNFIGGIQIAAEQVIAEIVVVEPEDVTNLEAPVEVTFSAENVAIALANGGLSIDAMNWDLDGNGSYETPVGASPTVSHLYNRRGTYTVGLQVRLAGEEEFRPPFTKVISISEAAFRADPDTGYAPLDVQFDASSLIPKGYKVQSLDWDFEDDGIYEKEGPDNLKPKFTFKSIGVYSVHLRVVDQQNNVENYYRDVEIVPSDTPLLTASISAVPSTSGQVPLQIRFDGSESTSVKGKIINYEWDFGDGSDLQSGKSVSHVYNESGTFNVVLTVEEDSGNTATTSITVQASSVSSIPVAKISTSPSFNEETKILNGVLPFKVEFDASDSSDDDNDIVDYKWDFDNDGVIDQEGKKASYTFDKAENYKVTLTVTDTENQSDEYSINVVVAEPGVVAEINAIPAEGTAPLVVQFDGSGSSTFEGNIVSYEWDFGDGSPKTITGASVTHKYNDVGNYNVNLSVLTNKSQSAQTSTIIYVREIPLLACFEPSRSNGAAPLAVTFDTKCSTGSVAGYSWDFGDGETSDSRKPTHSFENPGNYTVTLEVSDGKNNVSNYSDVIVVEGEIQ
ncbi:PKD domain-containing protein [Candidatus Peregrinibacteria bacterium]|nr:PKD domain-containing protein [Candidatus Peregrinibacteria bacterium]